MTSSLPAALRRSWPDLRPPRRGAEWWESHIIHNHALRRRLVPLQRAGEKCRTVGYLAISPDGSAVASRARVIFLGAVGVVTMITAFGIQAADNAWLLWHGTALVEHYRATLSYKSAVIGDGMVMPTINMLIAATLIDWGGRIRFKQVFPAILLGLGVTVTVHAYQAYYRLVNWTMPQPYQWTGMGYYHAAFMWSELTVIAFFLARMVWAIRRKGWGAITNRRVGLIAFGLWLFVDLLMRDYF